MRYPKCGQKSESRLLWMIKKFDVQAQQTAGSKEGVRRIEEANQHHVSEIGVVGRRRNQREV